MSKLPKAIRIVIKLSLCVLTGGVIFLWFKGLYFFSAGDWPSMIGITVITLIGALLLVIAAAPPPTSISIERRRSMNSEYDLGWNRCPHCNNFIGHQVATAVHSEFVKGVREAEEQFPGCNFYFGEIWSLSCPHCGSQIEFNYVRRTITLKEGKQS